MSDILDEVFITAPPNTPQDHFKFRDMTSSIKQVYSNRKINTLAINLCSTFNDEAASNPIHDYQAACTSCGKCSKCSVQCQACGLCKMCVDWIFETSINGESCHWTSVSWCDVCQPYRTVLDVETLEQELCKTIFKKVVDKNSEWVKFKQDTWMEFLPREVAAYVTKFN